MRRHLLSLGLVLVSAVAFAACTGRTTPASNVSTSSAQLNAVGSCDRKCAAFFRYGVSGGKWHYTKPFFVGRIGTTPFNAKVKVQHGSRYYYQVCGGEESSPGVYKSVCVGPDGQTNTATTFHSPFVKPPRSAVDAVATTGGLPADEPVVVRGGEVVVG